jgi:hypothetical protein
MGLWSYAQVAKEAVCQSESASPIQLLEMVRMLDAIEGVWSTNGFRTEPSCRASPRDASAAKT